MGKKCVICGGEAEFCIKGTSDYYCKGCAEEHFDDISVLQKVEDEAKRLKEFIKKRMEGKDDETIPDDEQSSSD